MAEFLKALFTDVSLDTLFVIAGIAFLGIAVIGNFSGKISPGKGGRIAAAVLGPILIIGGLAIHAYHWEQPKPVSTQPNPPPDVHVRPPVVQARMGELEWGKNRQGHDIVNFQSGSPAECTEACEKDPRCKAMTFVQHPNQAGGICWLKADVAPLSDAAGMVSSVKRFD